MTHSASTIPQVECADIERAEEHDVQERVARVEVRSRPRHWSVENEEKNFAAIREEMIEATSRIIR